MAAEPQVLARAFYHELLKIAESADLDDRARLEAVYQLLHLLFQEITKEEKLVFSTHFARIAYAAHKHRLDKTLLYYLHNFRRLVRRPAGQPASLLLAMGYRVLAEAIGQLLGEKPPAALQPWLPAGWPAELRPPHVAAFHAQLRVLALSDDPASQQLLARSEQQPEEVIRIQYNLPERNDYLRPTLEALQKVIGFPVLLNLLDVEVDESGLYRPRAMVVEPDFLIDVSAVADCYRGHTVDPWGYLLKKFLPSEQTQAIMLGNLANFFLDELMTDPEVSFGELKKRIFPLYPLAFCRFSDGEVISLLQQSQRHFVHLRQLVVEGFAQEGIEPAHCYLEPSFFSATYGLQGRLDLLHLPTAEAGRRSIVELKSGSPFMPNIHGISSNHFTQTALYDLLIRSTFGSNIHLGSYILYSKLDERPLRFAPASKIQQYEALQVRNQLLAIERMIAALGQGEADLLGQAERLFGRLSVARYPDISGFARNHLLLFEQVWQQLSAFEKRYFAAFAGMNARENALAKTGVQGQDKINGLASLWLDEADDKEQNFNWMRGLQVLENHAGSVEPIISFRRTERTNPLANFRLGDIALLYPERGDAAGALTNQIFKCNIVVLEEDRVAVKLRARQFNDRLFREHTHWVLEHDTSDLSFAHNYRGLFAFAQAPAAVRQRLLGLRPPAEAAAWQGSWPSALTEEQTALLNRMVKAEEYFLLWGPPGTGKTSLILHHLVRYLLENSAENLLLLAYTNRAVDEICETIEHIGSEEARNYVRIGSSEGTDLRFRAKLLQNLTAGLGSRKALLALLAKTRVVVGTVASVMGKQDLFEVKKFDRLIIDEASQILEPGLIGLLTRFPRCVLIGDHRQLPAVVTQPADASVVKDVSLQQQGFANLRDSLFERLYRQCQQRGWHWAYAQLSRQGRMHTDIMQFPAAAFYDGRLDILHNSLRQQQALNWQLPAEASHYDRWMAQHRLLFIPAAVDELSPTLKTNRFEADIIAELVASYLRLMKANQRTPDAGSIGIITPYRAQIALIRHVLQEKGITTEFPLTIDTVERYQGGARDVILVSLCTNAARQLTTLSSLSEEGVDRKLNVAMTRAREQLLIIGNPDLLARSPVYRQLLTYCRQHAAWATTADPERLPAQG